MEPMKKGHHRLEVMSHYYGKRIQQDMSNFVKWILLALLIGGVVGGASSLFAGCLGWVTQFRTDQPVVVLLLPFGGLLIVFLYQKIGKEDRGTTQVLSTIRSQDEVPLRSAPLIFIATALTHLLGGSAGREGAAIQLGGSIGNQLGRWIHLDEEDRHVIVMCGMSAAFSAVFGTPWWQRGICHGSCQRGRDVLCGTVCHAWWHRWLLMILREASGFIRRIFMSQESRHFRWKTGSRWVLSLWDVARSVSCFVCCWNM